MIFEKIDALVGSFLAGCSSMQEIRYTIDQHIHDKGIDISKFFRDYINDGIEHKNGSRVEFSLIISDIFGQDKILLDIYEKLLFETWHDRHEDIVDVISQHGNASSIPSLIKCLDMNLDCMKYNNSYSFHKKIIHAIQNLDGKNYKNHLKLIFQKLSPKLRAELKK